MADSGPILFGGESTLGLTLDTARSVLSIGGSLGLTSILAISVEGATLDRGGGGGRRGRTDWLSYLFFVTGWTLLSVGGYFR